MPDDTHADEAAAHAPRERDDTFEPIHTDDRFKRRVRDDHAPNAALHSALRAVTEDDDRASVNLMGSHAPGERPHEPRYHVRLSLENAGAGEPSTGETIIDDMVARDDVTILKAYGGGRFGDVDVPDGASAREATKQTIHESVDRLTVHLRPVETRVEPVEVRYDDLPDDVARVDDVEHDAARTLRLVVDEHGPDSDRANAAARALATVVYTADPDRWEDAVDYPDAAPDAAYRELWRRAGVDPDTGDVESIDGFPDDAPGVDEDGFIPDGATDDEVREAVEDVESDSDSKPGTATGRGSWE